MRKDLQLKIFEKRKKLLGTLLMTMLYPAFQPLALLIPNPMVDDAIIAFHMVFPIFAGYYFGIFSGAVAGGVGTSLALLVKNTPYTAFAILPHLLMGATAGFVKKKYDKDWICATTIILGHTFNMISYWAFEIIQINKNNLGETLLGLSAESMVNIIIIMFVFELTNYLKYKKGREYRIKEKPKIKYIIATLLVWGFLFTLIILSMQKNVHDLVEMLSYSFIIPILSFSFLFDRVQALSFSLISSIILGTFILSDPQVLDSAFSKRIIFQLIVLNFAALFTTRIKDKFRETQRKLSIHTFQTPVGVIELDGKFNIQLFNPAAENIFGFGSEFKNHSNIFDILFSEKVRQTRILNWENLLFKKKKSFYQINEHLVKGGKIIVCEWINTPLIDYNGKIIGVICLVNDITEKLQNVDQELSAQKIKALEVLAGTIVHDFNNIITSILANVHFMMEDDSLTEIQQSIMSDLEEAISNGKTLIDRLVVFSKNVNAKVELASIVEILKESISLISRGTNVNVILDVQSSIPNLKLNKVGISQTFNNLIINAVEAMDYSGKLAIKVKEIDAKMDSILPEIKGKYVKIIFKDMGEGIPENIQNKIFHPYFSTKADGSGLGLASAHYIIKKHGGYITFTSEPGKGTTFYIYLPINK